MNVKACLIVVILVTGYGLTYGQDAGCSGEEHRKFDFWIGKWGVKARDRAPGTNEWKANDTWAMTRVYSDLAGCAIIEESIDKAGTENVIIGKSITSYNVHLKQYQQFWVDNTGTTSEYIGNMEGPDMILYLEPKTATGEKTVPFQETTRLRMVFTDIESNSLTWLFQYSTDGGNQWTSTIEARYSLIER